MPDDNTHNAIIPYGTAAGGAEMVAECIAAGLKSQKIEAVTIQGEKVKPVEGVKNYDLIVLVCATYNVGKLQEYYEKFFYEEFIKLELPNKPMAAVGLGDSKNYDIFCGAADYLEEAIKITKGNQIMETLRIDGDPLCNAEDYEAWGVELAKAYYQTT